MANILVIDDEASLRQVLRIKLQRNHHVVKEAKNGEEGLILLEQNDFDIIFTDLKMPGSVDGMGVVQQACERHPSVQVIVMTAYATYETAIQAIKMGAYHYIEKPFQNLDEIEALVSRCMEKRALLQENVQLRTELRERYSFGNLLGKSKPMKELFGLLKKISSSNASVLITGENGTGKELVARALHYNGMRSQGPFQPVNCGAIPQTLLESELFGHVAGAFTGADREKLGLFRLSDGGTLFLDEIGDLPYHTQVKLLRVLEEREVRPIGGEQSIPVDVRIISATNKHLPEEVEKGHFREDLFYRLKVINIEMPPLRERREDIPFLADHFLQRFAKENGKELEGFSPSAMERLTNYTYRGNVRELKNIVERAVLLEAQNQIQPHSLPLEVQNHKAPMALSEAHMSTLPEEGLEPFMEKIERRLLLKALREANGVRTEAAQLLQITPRSFRYRIAKLDITDEEIAS